jgi:glutamyl/glutaminyl-tRNA synthetase
VANDAVVIRVGEQVGLCETLVSWRLLVGGLSPWLSHRSYSTTSEEPPLSNFNSYWDIPGTCRDKNISLEESNVGWRLKLDPGVEVFDDALAGRQEQDPSAQCGDFLLRDRLGNWTYQCVAAIDDAVQGVTLVIRGQDLLPSTGRQIRLASLIGRRAPPVFAHHPLIMKSASQKLSKSDGDSGIADLRAAGWSAAQVIGCAAALAGLTSGRDDLRLEDLPRLFSPSARTMRASEVEDDADRAT